VIIVGISYLMLSATLKYWHCWWLSSKQQWSSWYQS